MKKEKEIMEAKIGGIIKSNAKNRKLFLAYIFNKK